MSENDKIPGPPPPDDYSKTTPNLNLGDGDDASQSDWNKTNYNFPKQPAADEWGKTVTNIKPIDTENQDFGKTFYPGSQQSQQVPNAPEWGLTEPNVKVNPADFGSAPEDFGGTSGGGYEKTTPYFRLPEAERAKYQNLPPTPTERAEQEKREQKAKGGIPGWALAAAGIFSMFMFAVVVLLVVYFFLIPPVQKFETSIVKAPTGSRILVDGTQWGYTNDDGSIRLSGLEPGRRSISIVHASYECRDEPITGKAGEELPPISAQCTEKRIAPTDDCNNIGMGEFDKAELCYNRALDALSLPPTPEELVRALNILMINFKTAEHEVPPERFAALKKGAGFIKQLPPNIVLEVGGHTDTQGTDQTNLPLSQRRANAVKQKLVEYGVRGEALQTRGYGSKKPKAGADNATESGRFFNRRIEYAIVR